MKIAKNTDNLFVKMTSFQKFALSLSATLAIFSAFLPTANSFVFENLEAKFYKQAKIQENTAKLNEISQSYDDYFSDFLDFVNKNGDSYLDSQSVRSFYVKNPSELNVAERRAATETLFFKYPGLKGVRIIDKNGRNVHFSTFDKTDVFQQTGIAKTYKNYDEICQKSNEIAFADLEKHSDFSSPRFLFDEARSRIVISAPFYFTENVFSGYAFFYFDFFDLQSFLAEKNNFEYNMKLSLFSDSDFDGAFVQGVPESEKNEFKNASLEFYKKNRKIAENKIPEKLFRITADDKTDDFLVALSDTNGGVVKILGVYKNSAFEIPRDLYFAILLCAFISLFLLLFLIFSLKRDSAAVLKAKIKKLQIGIIRECFESGEKINFEAIYKKLESRKNDFSEEIVKSLKIRSKKKRNAMNLALKKNWEEIFSIFQTQIPRQNQNFFETQTAVPANLNLIEEIRKLLQDALKNPEIKTKTENFPRENENYETEIKNETAENKSESKNAEQKIDETDANEIAEDFLELEAADDAAQAEKAENADDAAVKEAENIEELEELNGDNEGEAEEEIEELSDAENPEHEEASDVAELEPLNEADEIASPKSVFGALTFAKLLDTNTFLKIIPNYAYSPTNETYFASDNFATVDNVFAEEICLGAGINVKNTVVPIDFKKYEIEKYWDEKSDKIKSDETQNQKEKLAQTNAENAQGDFAKQSGTQKNPARQTFQSEEIEELTEEVYIPKDLFYYSLTNFAENITSETPMLAAANAPQDVVVQEGGVFTISRRADYKNFAQDKDLKALVDSVV